MNKPCTFLLLLCLCAITLVAQTPNSLWYFGSRCGLDFSSGSPVAITNSAMQADEGCVTITDNVGNLRFYSNGDTVWNSSHTPMPNGTGLNGQLSCSQSALAIRKPGSTTIYYLFTLAAQGNANGLCWSEIDMTLNFGMGDVTANKNMPLVAPACEKLTAVRHANGIDVWVVVHQLNSNAFNAYLITGAGIGAPVISSVGTTVNSSFNMIETIGCMKFSCDGTRLAVAHYGYNITELLDFNKATGVISNPQVLNTVYTPYGVEFSPSCDYLYVSAWSWSGAPIYQYDLTATNIAASQTQIGTVPSSLGAAAGMQLGPDHKIYIAVLFADSISVIQNPDLPGLSCNFLANGVYLGGRVSYYGLPNSITGLYCIPANPDAVEEQDANELVSVYPNPATEFITVDGSQLNTDYTVVISNAFGQEIYSREYSRGIVAEIDLGEFEMGIYFAEITGTEFTFRRTFVVQ